MSIFISIEEQNINISHSSKQTELSIFEEGEKIRHISLVSTFCGIASQRA